MDEKSKTFPTRAKDESDGWKSARPPGILPHPSSYGQVYQEVVAILASPYDRIDPGALFSDMAAVHTNQREIAQNDTGVSGSRCGEGGPHRFRFSYIIRHKYEQHGHNENKQACSFLTR
jgi:hypothetical protein